MAKLKLLSDRSLDEDERIMSDYKNLMSEIGKKSDEGKIYYYQQCQVTSH